MCENNSKTSPKIQTFFRIDIETGTEYHEITKFTVNFLLYREIVQKFTQTVFWLPSLLLGKSEPAGGRRHTKAYGEDPYRDVFMFAACVMVALTMPLVCYACWGRRIRVLANREEAASAG